MRLIRPLMILLFAGLLALPMAGPARAATFAAFTPQAFKAAQAAGTPVLVDISASWCPTCAQQKKIIDRLAAEPEFARLLILHVDFDTQKDVVRALGARMQSTLIVFRGATLAGVSVGDTDPASIRALLARSLG